MSGNSIIIRSQLDNPVKMYTQMLRQGRTPNEHTYPFLLKSFSKSHKQNPNQIHTHILKFGFGSDSFVRNSLLSSYAKCGDLGNARHLFVEMSYKDSISWTAMIHGYVKKNMEDEGLILFSQMKSLGVKIEGMVIVSVLNGCGIAGSVQLGKCVHGFYVECGRVRWDDYIGSALVDMYAKCGDCDDARQVFEEMPSRNLVSWTSLISGYVQCNRYRDCLMSFQDMLAQGIDPNQMTFASVLTACAQLGALEQGRWVHHYIDRTGLGLNSFTGTALIDMYAKCGCIDDALRIFNGLSQKDVYPWTALINGLAIHGLVLECLDLFSKMIKEGVQPNGVTFLGVLCACSHGGLVDQGRMHFLCMCEEYRIQPKLEHFGCMVDLLGRGGLLKEALILVEMMPMEPSEAIWGSLLGACVVHKDFILGEKIGKKLIELHPQYSGGYSLLVNIYAHSRKWGEAARLRMAMRERRIEKTQGSSQVEVNGVLSEFISSDESHPLSKEIYETVAGMEIEGKGLISSL